MRSWIGRCCLKARRRLGEKRTERWKAVSVSVCSFVMAWPGFVDSSQSEQSEDQESQRQSRQLKVEEAKNDDKERVTIDKNKRKPCVDKKWCLNERGCGLRNEDSSSGGGIGQDGRRGMRTTRWGGVQGRSPTRTRPRRAPPRATKNSSLPVPCNTFHPPSVDPARLKTTHCLQIYNFQKTR